MAGRIRRAPNALELIPGLGAKPQLLPSLFVVEGAEAHSWDLVHLFDLEVARLHEEPAFFEIELLASEVVRFEGGNRDMLQMNILRVMPAFLVLLEALLLQTGNNQDLGEVPFLFQDGYWVAKNAFFEAADLGTVALAFFQVLQEENTAWLPGRGLA